MIHLKLQIIAPLQLKY